MDSHTVSRGIVHAFLAPAATSHGKTHIRGQAKISPMPRSHGSGVPQKLGRELVFISPFPPRYTESGTYKRVEEL